MSNEVDPDEYFVLPDGTMVRTGNRVATPAERALVADVPVYSDDFLMDPADIEKSLKGDVYKMFRKQRGIWILNQAQLGKCNASATINAKHNRRATEGLPHIVLSDCHLYMRINGGRDSGSLLQDGFREVAANGVSPRKLSKNGQDYTLRSDVHMKSQVPAEWLSVANQEAMKYRSWEAYKLPVDSYDKFKIAVASALARDHQIIHAWHVGGSSMRLNNGYVRVGSGPGNHATLFHSGKWVGGQDLVHPDCENSWGPSKDPMYGPTGSAGWGEDGFGLFTMQDAFRCTQYHDYWVYVGSRV